MFIQRFFKILEIHFCKTLAKVTGSAVRINSKKPKVKKKNDERKKKLEAATPGFEPATQLPSAKKVWPLATTRPCHHYQRCQPLEDLKSGDCLFFTTPRNFPAPTGNDLGHYMMSYIMYILSKFEIIVLMLEVNFVND